MATELLDELHVPTDPDEQRRLHTEVLRRWLRLVPEAADEAVQQGIQQSMRHLFERRLGRRLDAVEQAVLQKRLALLGADRLGDVVLDLDAPCWKATRRSFRSS